MKTYCVHIEEILSRAIELEATSEEEAFDAVRAMYQDEEIVLDDTDFQTVSFYSANYEC